MNKPFPSGTVSAKLTPSMHEKITSIYQELFGDNESITFKELLEQLVIRYNTQGQNLEIEELNAEIERLKGFEHENFRMKSELAILKDQVKEKELPANSIIVTIEPVVDHFLQLMASRASKVWNKTITKADILKNLFWDQIVSGPGDHLPLIITKDAISKVITDLKTQQQDA